MKSARDIFYSYPKLPVDAPMPMYVEVGEYEALKAEIETLKNTITLSAINNHNLVESTYNTMNKEVKILLGLLKQWQSIAPITKFHIPEAYKDLVTQLITDTEAQLGTLGNLD